MANLFRIADSVGEHRASALFLHGLGGHPYRTWGGSDVKSCWLGWLTDDIKGLAVWSVGYEAQISRSRISELRQERSREEAALLGDEARIDRLQLNYRTAANKFAEAAALLTFDAEAALNNLVEQGNTLQSQGEEFGDNSALVESVLVRSACAAMERFANAIGRDARPPSALPAADEIPQCIVVCDGQGAYLSRSAI
jgi:hypothetical protein